MLKARWFSSSEAVSISRLPSRRASKRYKIAVSLSYQRVKVGMIGTINIAANYYDTQMEYSFNMQTDLAILDWVWPDSPRKDSAPLDVLLVFSRD